MTETNPVRTGEELDNDRLAEYLRSALGRPGDVFISQFPAGSSNLTYSVRLAEDEFVLRRPPFGNTVKSAHDVKREFGVLSMLSRVYPPAPKPLLFCDDASIIGSEFYLMERRHGLIIRGRVGRPDASKSSSNAATSQIELLNSSQEFRLNVCRAFMRNLAGLHALDFTAAGLADLGRPEGYARRQVEGWTKRYFAARTDEHPRLEETVEWLNRHIPADSAAALVHNDYKFDNIMLDPHDLTRIAAVLDWEMVTIGDPVMDLGTTLGYWMSPDAGDAMLGVPFNPRVLMENVSRLQLVEMYAEASGRDVSNILYYYVFGSFKIAVIAQQIYARYVKGSTQDKRFASFNKFVAALGHISANAVERGTI